MFWKYLICFLYCVMCINIVSFLFIIITIQISLYHTGNNMVHPLQKITSYATARIALTLFGALIYRDKSASSDCIPWKPQCNYIW